jgi:sodium/potassium-transporting ATPase subunit alpha
MNLPEDRPSVDIQATVAAANAIAAADAARAEGKTKGKKKKLSKDDKANDLRAAIKMDEHYIPFDELYTRFGVDVKTGLTDKQVKKKQATEGMNCLTPPKEKPEWLKLLETQKGFFNILLWAGAILCFIGYALQQSVDNLYLGIVLSFVVTVTGIFEYFQERNASNLMAQFKNMLPPAAMTKRNGTEFQPTPSLELCRGDIVRIKAGDKIPADIRVISASDDMKVEQSALTGEPDNIKKHPECTNEKNPLETHNLLFFGTLCPSGSCEGIVVNIGDYTVMGRISAITTQTEDGISPIKKEINRFVLLVSAVAVFLGVTFFIIGAALKTDPITNLVFMIGIIVANVPEGLLATVTVCLSLTAQRMYHKNVLVKQLESVETLGSTSCICSDKTGTLTINKMTVANICVDTSIFETEDGRTNSKDFPLTDLESNSIKRITRCMVNCNNATWVDKSRTVTKEQEANDTTGELKEGDAIPFRKAVVLGTGAIDNRIMWEPAGDASESAMIKYAQESPLYGDGPDGARGANAPGIERARKDYPKISTMAGGTSKTWEIKFNSKNKYQVSVHRQPDSEKALLMMKGAPERILNRCSHAWHNGERVELTAELRAKYEELNLDLASMGRRCLAFCQQELEPEADGKFSAEWTGFSTEPVNYPIGEDEETVKAAIAEAEAKGKKCMTYDMAACGKLTYIGMTALIDPPRKQVPPAVEKCKSAGIKVVMVTGDHPATAQAIAREVGIIWGSTEKDIRKANVKDPIYEGAETLPMDHPNYDEARDPDFAPAIVVPGWEFDHLTDKATWDDFLRHGQIVFARTSPQQKLIIVENFQARGQVVAVTGDGVNDAPALKKADIGVAMGIMGSDVSKEAANMILLDDNFASIVAGVEEGRLIFDNLKKSIAYTLSSNIPEISPFLAFITIGVPLPLSTILILCVDLGTDMVPAISMAWENHEADIMSRNPRNKDTDHLVTLKLVCFAYLQIGVVQALAGFFSWITVMNDYGYASYTLPTLGHFDNWGKQVLYCKLEDGVLRNEAGNAYSMNFADMSFAQKQGAMAEGYMFYDTDNVDFNSPADAPVAMDGVKVGKIVQCAHPGKNFMGDATSSPAGDSSWNKVLGSKSSYYKDNKVDATQSWTNGYVVPTTQSVLAMHAAGFIEYLPFKSRMSPFYDNRWKHWPIKEKGEGLGIFGVGETTLDLIHYQTQPLGQNTILSTTADNTHASTEADATGPVKALWTDDAGLKNFSVAGINRDGLNKAYKKTVWNMPGVDAGNHTNDQKDLLLTASNLRAFTIYPREAPSAGAAHFDYSNSPTGAVERSGNTVWDSAGAIVNRLYSWAGAKDLPTDNTFAADAKFDGMVYMNVISRMMQKEALAHAQCAGFICIIVVQWADLMICKTRWLSIRQQGMVNPIMNFGLLFETILGCFLCYVPGLGDVLGTRPIRFQHWFPGMPFCLFIFFYDEMRKYLMRSTSKKIRDKDTKKMNNIPGWLEINTYY